MEVGQPEPVFEVDQRAKTAERGLLLCYEVLIDTAELYHLQSNIPSLHKTGCL